MLRFRVCHLGKNYLPPHYGIGTHVRILVLAQADLVANVDVFS